MYPQRKRRLFWGALLVIVLLASGCTVQAADQTLFGQIAQIQEATKAFQDVRAAEAAGYAQFLDCTHESGHGAMGIHYVNGDLVGDTVLDVSRPEAVLYEPAEGELRLVGVEYVVFAEGWDAEHAEPPTLIGQPFRFVDSPNRYDLPPFYALHAWVWKQNPQGTFVDWNPEVMCP
jgi:hypothetical protein